MTDSALDFYSIVCSDSSISDEADRMQRQEIARWICVQDLYLQLNHLLSVLSVSEFLFIHESLSTDGWYCGPVQELSTVNILCISFKRMGDKNKKSEPNMTSRI